MAVDNKKTNGCGPSWMPRWLKTALFDWFFEASCNRHDQGYEKGGDEIRRFECDWKFWRAMKRDIKRLAWYLRPVAVFVGLAFYLMVRAFGWLQFNYHGCGVWTQIIAQKMKGFFSIRKKS
ncbi:MAG: hypothetical protein CMH98_01140 [Oceanospirillaceae bacterium]|nr:hypothetical protein [Oceanospirillaceae bacterium]